ncbi:hypothetical protein GF407_01585 [candidate division KSB1 bacterium]|nr:hypothetical protein [candidate division KSB1 bacterium]
MVKLEIPACKGVENTSSGMTLTMVPYYAWNNRGIGSMMVWLATKKGMFEE